MPSHHADREMTDIVIFLSLSNIRSSRQVFRWKRLCTYPRIDVNGVKAQKILSYRHDMGFVLVTPFPAPTAIPSRLHALLHT